MKAALMNQNTMPFVDPPSGPLASAPVASAANQNMWYNSTDFGPCKYVSVFNSSGLDGINCGRPSWVAQLLPNASYTIELITSLVDSAGTCALSIGESGNDQLALVNTSGTSTLLYRCGGTATDPVAYTANKFDKFSLVSTGTQHRLTIGANQSTLTSNGPLTSVNNLTLGSRSPAGLIALNGQYAKMVIKNGSGVIIDALDLNKWDGSLTVLFDSGQSCTISDSSPMTRNGYACIPWSLLA